MDWRIPAIIVVVLAVAAAGFAVLHGRGGGPGAPQGPRETTSAGGARVELGLHAGDVLVYNITWSIEAPGPGGGANTTNASYTEYIRVSGFSSEYLISANLSRGAGGGGSGSIPYGLLALPTNSLGSDHVDAPVITPLGGVCMRLELRGETVWRGWRALVYEGSVSGPGYELYYRGVYNRSNGIDLEVNTTAVLHAGNLTSRVYLGLRLSSYKPSGAAALSTSVPAGSFCAQPVSSDLRLCADGFYLITGSAIRPVTLHELEEATKGPSVVVILNKYCPHCQRFWPNLLEARASIKAPIYAVIFSGSTGLSNPEVADAIDYVANKASLGATQGLPTPSIIVFPGHGKTPAYRAGEMTAADFASWVNSVLGS